MDSTTHSDQLAFLKKIEGQIRGIQRMIEEGRYCVDILMQLHSVMGALARVEQKVFKKHLEGCVAGVMKGGSRTEQEKKIDEVIKLVSQLRKIG
jgi:DNA-binding FrmR family transcriptional regulator